MFCTIRYTWSVNVLCDVCGRVIYLIIDCLYDSNSSIFIVLCNDTNT